MRLITYHGTEGVELESGYLKAVILPGRGCKLASLVNKETGFEFLTQPSEETLSPVYYGESYAPNGLFGMDDMFPTINATFYPVAPWKGTPLPDHGELWTAEWDYEFENEVLKATVRGIRLPYKFEKKIWFSQKRTLRMDYIITNETSYSMPFIWAAHPLFVMEKGTRVSLPAGAKTIVNTLNMNNRLGKTGAIHPWPETIDRFGNPYDISLVGQHDCTCDKLYVREQMKKGEISLYHPVSNEELKMHFPVNKVPHIGLWINRRGYEDQFNVGPEPATGALDDLYVAYFMEKCSVLLPRGTYSFHLEFTVK